MGTTTHPKTQLMHDFNHGVAPKLAAQLGATEQLDGKGWSKRFAYFLGPGGELMVVAGDQEEEKVDLALAYGLTYRDQRPLVLVLPGRRAFPTLQRAPWLTKSAQPTIYCHDGGSVEDLVELPATSETIDRVAHVTARTPGEELRNAATSRHLGHRSSEVFELVEWATTHPMLDAAHRQGERAWHCMGQKVLSIRRGRDGLKIRGGVHTTKPEEPSSEADDATAPVAADLRAIKQRVKKGIADRMSPTGKHHRPDEHWLQAVIRRDPSLVGVEQPALREVPAWRPAAKRPKQGDPGAWGRGFIDLVGLDGHGDLRIVETKLAANQDELLIFQGLDYYIWANAYRDVLLERLGASNQAQIVVHYVIGDDPKTDSIKLSHFAAAQAAALTIRWRVQTICHWYPKGDEDAEPHSTLYPERTLPG